MKMQTKIAIAPARKMSAAQFNRLKPATRRVKIAEDVIATLALPRGQRFKPTQGQYCTVTMSEPIFESDTQIQSILPKIEKHCEACAMGAFFLSHVRLANHVTVEESRDNTHWLNDPLRILIVDDDKIEHAMRGYFDDRSLRYIEAAFEGQVKAYVDGFSCEDEEAASEWESRIPSPTARLRAICENIVRHKGDFNILDIPSRGRKK